MVIAFWILIGLIVLAGLWLASFLFIRYLFNILDED